MAELKVEPLRQEDLPPARVVNYFRVARIGTEVQVITGYMDMQTIVDGLQTIQKASAEDEEQEDVSLHVQPVARLALGPRGLHELKTKINEIYDAMLESGHIPEELVESGAEEEGDNGPGN